MTVTTPALDFSRYVAERAAGFNGRGWALSAIHSWLQTPDAPRLLTIVGAPGSGKTALAARLVQLSRGEASADGGASFAPGFLSAWHFCSTRDQRWLSPRAFAESLARQLAERYLPFGNALQAQQRDRVVVIANQRVDENHGTVIGVKIERLDLRVPTAAEAFRLAVREPLEVLCAAEPETPVVILVDALDEAFSDRDGREIAVLLARAHELPANVRLIVTTRPEVQLLRQLGRYDPPPTELSLTRGEGLARSKKDIRDHVCAWVYADAAVRERLSGGLTPESLAERVGVKSGGNFLYARLVLATLAARAGAIDMAAADSFPKELDAAYLEYLERLVGGSRMREHHLTTVLGLLAVAREPLEERQVAALTGLQPSVAHRVLLALNQVLDKSASGDRVMLYHWSFAEVLLDQKRASHFWCPAAEAHARITAAYRGRMRSWSRVAWRDVDDYGLRHLAHHVAESQAQPAAALSEFLCPEFFAAKSERFGTDFALLADLDLALDVTTQQGDVALLLRWTWAHAGLRDQMAYQAAPQLLPAYVRAGQVARALEMLAALDVDHAADEYEGQRVRVAMVRALAQEGHLDDALTLADERIGDQRRELRCAIAEAIAGVQPAKAVRLTEEEGCQGTRVYVCRALAARDDFLEEALRLASDSGEAQMAIARRLAERDEQRALALAAANPRYEESNAGDNRLRTGDVVRVDVAIQRAMRGQLAAAEAVMAEVRDRTERRRALLGISAATAAHDAEHALEFALRYRGDFEERWSFNLADTGESEEVCEVEATWLLALAHAAVEGGVRPADPGRLREAWHGGRQEIGGDLDQLDAITRCELRPLRSSSLAREIGLEALGALDEYLNEHSDHVRYLPEAVAALAGALALFDLDRALVLVERVAEAHRSTSFVREEGQLGVIRALAGVDPSAAREVVMAVRGPHAHTAYLTFVDLVAPINFEEALAFVEAIDPQFSITRAQALGVLASHLAVGDAESARTILKRLPAYVDSQSFRETLGATASVVACYVALEDPKRAARVIADYASGSKDRAAYCAGLAEVLATRDPRQAREVLDDLKPGLQRARATVAVARAAPDANEARLLLGEAADMLRSISSGYSERHELAAEIVALLAPKDPSAALDVALLIVDSPDGPKAMRLAIEAGLRAGGSPLAFAKWFYELDGGDEEKKTLGEHATNFRMRASALRALVDAISEQSSEEIISWLDRRHSELAYIVGQWHRAAQEPEAVLREWRESRRSPRIGLRDAARRAARLRPELALEAWNARRERGVEGRDRVFVAAVAEIALANPQLGINLASAALEEVSRMADAWDALRSAAAAIAPRDWRAAFDLVRAIPDPWARNHAIEKVLEAIDPGALARDDELRGTALREIDAEREAQRRRGLYRALARTLQRAPVIPGCAATLLRDLVYGDRGTYMMMLPLIARLACAEDPTLAGRLADELERVRALLAA